MCAPKAPKPPKVEKIPIHQMMVLPDGGDPGVRQSLRGNRGRLARSAMMFANKSGGLGMPTTTALAAPGGA